MNCPCVLRQKLDKCQKDVQCDSCGCCMAFQGYSEDQTTCLDCEEFKVYDKIAEENGIKYAIWSDENVKDFSKPHPFKKAKYAASDNSHCCAGWGKVEIKGDIWLDIWKAADRICKGTRCDHRYVEWFSIIGDELLIHFGS